MCEMAPVDRTNADSISDVSLGLYILLLHLIDHCDDLAFIDVGCFVGDVSIRYANFFRTLGHNGKVICFDPTQAIFAL